MLGTSAWYAPGAAVSSLVQAIACDQRKMFPCSALLEGEFGLKMYDISNLENINLIEHFKDISSVDVIPFMDVLMVIGNDGFHQYSYDCDKGEIGYISTIPINRL